MTEITIFRKIPLENAVAGMKVMEPIVLNGTMLMEAGVELNQDNMRRLKKRGVKYVSVDRSVAQGVKVDTRPLLDFLKQATDATFERPSVADIHAAVEILGDNLDDPEVLHTCVEAIRIPDDSVRTKIIGIIVEADLKLELKADVSGNICRAMIAAMRMYAPMVKEKALELVEKYAEESVIPDLVPVMPSMPPNLNDRMLKILGRMQPEPVMAQADILLQSPERLQRYMGIQIMALYKPVAEINRLKKQLLGLKKKEKLFEKQIAVSAAEQAFAAPAAETPKISNPIELRKYEPVIEEKDEQPNNELKLMLSEHLYSPVPPAERYARYTSRYMESVDFISKLLKDIREGRRPDVPALISIAASIIYQVKEDTSMAFKMTSTSTRDNYLISHLMNVAYVSAIIGERAGLEDNKLLELTVSALMHDVGMTKVQNLVWNKPEKIGELEYFDIQKHTVFGVDSLSSLARLSRTIAFVAYQHHERMDGSGYPKGRRRHHIVEYARIVGLADVYVALTSPRPYREPYEPYQAMETIAVKMKGAFDPEYLVCLSGFLAEYVDEDVAALFGNDRDLKLSGNEENQAIQVGSPLQAQNGSAMRKKTENRAKESTSIDTSLRRENFILSSRKDKVKANILMIDDDPGIAIGTQQIIEEGLPVALDACTNGYSGLKQLGRKKYDLVMVDVGITGIDGITLLRAVRRSPEHRHIPILMVTGQRDRRIVEWAIELSVQGVVLKPFQAEMIKTKVSDALIQSGNVL